jgi:cytochrome c55X
LAVRDIEPEGVTMLGQEQHLLLLLLALLGLPGEAKEPPPEREAQIVAQVRSDCGGCHGAELRGGFGPSLLPRDLADKPVGQVAGEILLGKPGTRMPPWAGMLTLGEARWLAGALREGLAEAEEGPAAPADPAR